MPSAATTSGIAGAGNGSTSSTSRAATVPFVQVATAASEPYGAGPAMNGGTSPGPAAGPAMVIDWRVSGRRVQFRP
jgi:hypothetical protein